MNYSFIVQDKIQNINCNTFKMKTTSLESCGGKNIIIIPVDQTNRQLSYSSLGKHLLLDSINFQNYNAIFNLELLHLGRQSYKLTRSLRMEYNLPDDIHHNIASDCEEFIIEPLNEKSNDVDVYSMKNPKLNMYVTIEDGYVTLSEKPYYFFFVVVNEITKVNDLQSCEFRIYEAHNHEQNSLLMSRSDNGVLSMIDADISNQSQCFSSKKDQADGKIYLRQNDKFIQTCASRQYIFLLSSRKDDKIALRLHKELDAWKIDSVFDNIIIKNNSIYTQENKNCNDKFKSLLFKVLKLEFLKLPSVHGCSHDVESNQLKRVEKEEKQKEEKEVELRERDQPMSQEQKEERSNEVIKMEEEKKQVSKNMKHVYDTVMNLGFLGNVFPPDTFSVLTPDSDIANVIGLRNSLDTFYKRSNLIKKPDPEARRIASIISDFGFYDCDFGNNRLVASVLIIFENLDESDKITYLKVNTHTNVHFDKQKQQLYTSSQKISLSSEVMWNLSLITSSRRLDMASMQFDIIRIEKNSYVLTCHETKRILQPLDFNGQLFLVLGNKRGIINDKNEDLDQYLFELVPYDGLLHTFAIIHKKTGLYIQECNGVVSLTAWMSPILLLEVSQISKVEQAKDKKVVLITPDNKLLRILSRHNYANITDSEIDETRAYLELECQNPEKMELDSQDKSLSDLQRFSQKSDNIQRTRVFYCGTGGERGDYNEHLLSYYPKRPVPFFSSNTLNKVLYLVKDEQTGFFIVSTKPVIEYDDQTEYLMRYPDKNPNECLMISKSPSYAVINLVDEKNADPYLNNVLRQEINYIKLGLPTVVKFSIFTFALIDKRFIE